MLSSSTRNLIGLWLNWFKTHCVLFCSTCTAEASQVMYNIRYHILTGYTSNTTQCILFASKYTAKQLNTMYYSVIASLILYFFVCRDSPDGNLRRFSSSPVLLKERMWCYLGRQRVPGSRHVKTDPGRSWRGLWRLSDTLGRGLAFYFPLTFFVQDIIDKQKQSAHKCKQVDNIQNIKTCDL